MIGTIRKGCFNGMPSPNIKASIPCKGVFWGGQASDFGFLSTTNKYHLLAGLEEKKVVMFKSGSKEDS